MAPSETILTSPPSDAVFAVGAFDLVPVTDGRVGCFSCQGPEVPTAWALGIGTRILDDGAEASYAVIWFCDPCLDTLADLLGSRG
jgi:hypothetical protein